MRTPARFALRFLFLVAAIGLVSMLVAPPGPAHGPYLSALSALSASSVHADPSCANKGCPIMSNGNCAHKDGFAGCALVNGACEDRQCF